VLRWNRLSHYLLLFFLCAGLLFGQQAETAVLLRGPNPGRGLDFLQANVIEYQEGLYRYGDIRFTVYYTEKRFPAFSEWRQLFCGEETVYDIADTQDRVYFYPSDEWNLFLRFPADFEGICPILTEFLQRFRFFMNTREESPIIPFPAVLRFGE
jgi:hypothetical protein